MAKETIIVNSNYMMIKMMIVL